MDSVLDATVGGGTLSICSDTASACVF